MRPQAFIISAMISSACSKRSSESAVQSKGTDTRRSAGLLPPCGARNALDCALWELEAELSGIPVWQLAGVSRVRSLW